VCFNSKAFMENTLLLSHPFLLNHGRSNHPENRERLSAILSKFESSFLSHSIEMTSNRIAQKDELSLVHSEEYISHVFSLDGQETSLDHETPLTQDSVKAACIAAGLSLEMIDRVINLQNSQQIKNGFLLVRPPGHHARPSQGMGFCIFNNIALAAKRAISSGINRILILDWDVHHGNGTQETFYKDNRVLFIDLHQENLFPSNSGLTSEQGEGKGLGFTINVPMPHSCTNNDYLFVIDNLVKPIATRYQPELILVSAGFDAHEEDPLGSMRITTKGYGLLTEKVKELADKLCNGKLILFLEGGYQPNHLASNVLQCAEVLRQGSKPTNSISIQEVRNDVISLTKHLCETCVIRI